MVFNHNENFFKKAPSMIYSKEHEFESYRPKFEPLSGLSLTVAVGKLP